MVRVKVCPRCKFHMNWMREKCARPQCREHLHGVLVQESPPGQFWGEIKEDQPK